MAEHVIDIFGAVNISKDATDKKSAWTKIGAGFLNKDESISYKFQYKPRHPDTTIQFRWVDGKAPNQPSEKGTLVHVLWGVHSNNKAGDDEKTFWDRIGVAFANADGSMNAALDYFPVEGGVIQGRPPKSEAPDSDASPQK